MSSSIDFDTPGEVVRPPAKLAHMVLRTNNLVTMSKFYEAFLGGHVVIDTPTMKFLTYDEEHHRIAIVETPGCEARNINSCGLEHTAFSFDTLPELLQSYRQRLKHNIRPVWCVHHGPTVSIYYHDPDHNMLETQWDTSTPEEASAMLQTEAFLINPFGVDFDPEEYIEKLQAGARESDFKERPMSGPRGPESVPGIVRSINQYEDVMAKRQGAPAVAATA